MTLAWTEDVRQTALIDEAEQLAQRYLSPEFAEVCAAYAVIGMDAIALAQGLQADTRDARAARAELGASQAGIEVQAGESRDAVTQSAIWFDQLRLAGRYANTISHPLGPLVDRLAAAERLSADSWSRARDCMGPCLAALAGVNLAGSGLPGDFVARGEALAARLDDERGDGHAPWLVRDNAAKRLDTLLPRIRRTLEQFVAGRDLAMSLTGTHIPGLELGLVKSAAAPRSAPADEGSGTPGL